MKYRLSICYWLYYFVTCLLWFWYSINIIINVIRHISLFEFQLLSENKNSLKYSGFRYNSWEPEENILCEQLFETFHKGFVAYLILAKVSSFAWVTLRQGCPTCGPRVEFQVTLGALEFLFKQRMKSDCCIPNYSNVSVMLFSSKPDQLTNEAPIQ